MTGQNTRIPVLRIVGDAPPPTGALWRDFPNEGPSRIRAMSAHTTLRHCCSFDSGVVGQYVPPNAPCCFSGHSYPFHTKSSIPDRPVARPICRQNGPVCGRLSLPQQLHARWQCRYLGLPADVMARPYSRVVPITNVNKNRLFAKYRTFGHGLRQCICIQQDMDYRAEYAEGGAMYDVAEMPVFCIDISATAG